jgi:hypothetical protein
MSDPYANLKQHALTPGRVKELLAAVPVTKISVSRKERKRRGQFIMVPWTWVEKLEGAPGQTYRTALLLLYEHWRQGKPIKLNNRMLETIGVSRYSKWRALPDLEGRGLIAVERRPKRSPVVRVLRC